MAGVRAAVALACSGFLFAAPALAQDAPATEEIRSDTDPTKPVLLSLREEYYDLIGDSFQNVVIVRAGPGAPGGQGERFPPVILLSGGSERGRTAPRRVMRLQRTSASADLTRVSFAARR
jgi:hypothetical protein